MTKRVLYILKNNCILQFNIFMSYAHDDFAIQARKTSSYISKYVEDCDVFLDKNETAGEQWKKVIRKAIDLCDIFIIIITPAAIESKPIDEEISLAITCNKKVIPCKETNFELNWNATPWNLGQYDTVDFDDADELRRCLLKKIKLIIKKQSKVKKNQVSQQESISEIDLPKLQIKTKTKTLFKPLTKKKTVSLLNYSENLELVYFMKQGDLRSVIFDSDTTSIILDIMFDENHIAKHPEMIISIPRDILDAKRGNEDDEFFALMDGEETHFQETVTPSKRILRFLLSAETKNIEIIGTHSNKKQKCIKLLKNPKFKWRKIKTLQRKSGMNDQEFNIFKKRFKLIKSAIDSIDGEALYKLPKN